MGDVCSSAWKLLQQLTSIRRGSACEWSWVSSVAMVVPAVALRGGSVA